MRFLPKTLRRWWNLSAQVKDLENTLAKRTLESEEHIATARHERDEAMSAAAAMQRWIAELSSMMARDIPSIFKQTDWECGMFNFGKAEQPSIDYFNPSLLEVEGKTFLMTRRARNWPSDNSMNDIVAFELDKDLIPVRGTVIKLSQTVGNQHFEDPRTFIQNGQIYLSCTSFLQVPRGFSYSHQMLFTLTSEWRTKDFYCPLYGHNQGRFLANTSWEKNWLWFFHETQLYMVYQTRPHTVVPFNATIEAGEPLITNFGNPLWVHGQPRGGTPPVLVGDEYWTFFHSSVPWTEKLRRYHMGVLAFESKPPFRITKMSSLPLITGSKNDRWNEKKPLVVFPCGALLRDGVWLVSLGVNDLGCAWFKIPHKDIENLVQPTIDMTESVVELTPERKMTT